MRAATKALLRVLNQARYGLRFTAGSQSVSFAPTMPTAAISVEWWAIPTLLPTSSRPAQTNNFGAGAAGSWSTFFSGGFRPTFQVNDNGAVARSVQGAIQPANVPVHCISTCDGTNIRLYVNGALAAGPTACVVTLTGASISMGVVSAGASLMVDDVRIYNRVLNADEVLDRYQGQHIQDNLVLWAGFDEGSGSTAYDYSGAGLTAAIPAGPAFEQFNGWPGTEGQLVTADLYTFYDASGAVLGRYTNLDADFRINGNTFSATGPLFKRQGVRFFCGVEVSELEIQIMADGSQLLAGVPWLRSLKRGTLDGGRVLLERFLSDDWKNTGVGTIKWFGGIVGPITNAGRSSATLKAKSDLNLLNIQMPRNSYAPPCGHNLYDAACTADKTKFNRSSTAQAGSTVWQVNTTLTQAAGYFALGTIAFTGGANAGLTRMVKGHTGGGVLRLMTPLPVVPAPGDAFTVYAGCNKQQATCGGFAGSPPFTADPATDLLTLAFTPSTDQAWQLATTGTLPAPLAPNTTYFVVNVSGFTCKLSLTLGGAAINITTAGTGTHSVALAGKFANLPNFGGKPFVPVPEALL